MTKRRAREILKSTWGGTKGIDLATLHEVILVQREDETVLAALHRVGKVEPCPFRSYGSAAHAWYRDIDLER